MASVLSEEQFRCSICLDLFHNPVSIPCGHNFCLGCIKRFWDTRHKSECPLCKEAFKNRPELRINVGLKDITEQFKRSLKDKSKYKTAQTRRRGSRPSLKSDEVLCDNCQDNKISAVKSCFVCRESYCEIHLALHLRDEGKSKHMLMDPTTFIQSHACHIHRKPLVTFCKTDNRPVCVKCSEKEHKYHDITPIENESRRVRSEMKKTVNDIQQMIHDRVRVFKEIKASVDLSKINKEREIQTSIQLITMVVSTIERNQALFVDELEQKQAVAEMRGEALLTELGQEINELGKRRNDLELLENTEDPILLIQSFSSLAAPLSGRDWSNVRVHSDNFIGALRRAFANLVDLCDQLENKLSVEEVSKTNQYAKDVTLDPTTAASWLILSPDGKKVSLGFKQRKVAIPDDPRRFDSCVAVLGKQGFSAGRHYWVVQVADKTDWDLGVAKESINKKGVIMVRPDSGYWAICRRKGGSLSACAGPSITLHLQEIPQKVGVFLDYDEGLVSFYDAEAKTHIYTYSQCTFTEPLYAYLNPCLHDNGKNTAPLVICPVQAGYQAETAQF